jgi:hypothetical protein
MCCSWCLKCWAWFPSSGDRFGSSSLPASPPPSASSLCTYTTLFLNQQSLFLFYNCVFMQYIFLTFFNFFFFLSF